MSVQESELWAAKSSDGQFVRHSVRLKNGMTCSKILLFTDEKEALSIHKVLDSFGMNYKPQNRDVRSIFIDRH